MPTIPDAVRLLADFPATYGPEIPAEAPAERVRDARFTLILMQDVATQMVEALDLGEDVAGAVEDVRVLLRGRGSDRAVWFVAPTAKPAGLLEQLRECGLEAATEPPWEPRFASMVLLEPPAPGPDTVIARPVENFEEFQHAFQLDEDVFGIPENDRTPEAHQRTRWELQLAGRSPMVAYVGVLDGEIVGVARSLLADAAVNLSGGSVRPDARGRGVYRALVRARWDDAVTRGTPALTVQAGRMSRPVLEKLGFTIISHQDCLIDRFA